MPETKQLTFTGIVEKQDDAWVAHCLETGMVATSALSPKDAISKMSTLLDGILTFAIRHGRVGDIYHSAPQEVVNKFINTEMRAISSQKTFYPIEGQQQRLTVEQNAYAVAC
jgi:hypothetical protein